MTTQAERLLRIESPDGRKQYSVSEATYLHTKMGALDGQTYQDAGYKVVSYEDGTAYEEGSEPTAFAIASHVRAPEIGATEEETTSSASANVDTSNAPRPAVASTTASNAGQTAAAASSNESEQA